MITVEEFWLSTGLMSQDGPMFERLAAMNYQQSTSSVEDSPAKIFPTPDEGQVWMESVAGCSLKRFAWFDNADPSMYCWRTWQRCLLEDWTEFSGRWPRSGTMRNGIAYRLPPLVPRISGTGYSSLLIDNGNVCPTPQATERSGNQKPGSHLSLSKWVTGQSKGKLSELERSPSRTIVRGLGVAETSETLPTPAARDWKSGKGKTQVERGRSAGPSLAEVSGGQLNPTWVEWLMGFPIGFTDLEDSETP